MRTFTDMEQIICTTARLMEEDKLYFVAIGGPPLVSVLLAKRLYAPKIAYVVEDGTIAPQVPLPAPPFLIAASGSSYRAVAWTDMNTVACHAALGHIDYGVLAAVQVDEYGNFNSTFVGPAYERPARRFGGPGGANEIASLCWRTILTTRQQGRKFVRKLDFMSSPGFLDGSAGARERAGLPSETGPWRVVTEMAVFDFEEDSRRMRLRGVVPWATVNDVLAEMEFEPLVANELDTLDVPSEEELTVLRSEVDPTGRTIRGRWLTVEIEGNTAKLIAQEGQSSES
ncbi:MAG: acyl CoA--acetate/3-ketoacid CoA transferase subunit beta [Chloroflexi bacterium]|nr:acyl CoA--acetate/3-ketoacid CoA transferase subunit beta [Chloroflexota bacterium]